MAAAAAPAAQAPADAAKPDTPNAAAAQPDGQTPPAAVDGPKPDAAKPADTPADTPAPATPPAKYTLAIPDGAQDWLEAGDLAPIEAIAKAKGWTNEEAQAAVDEHVDALAAVSTAFREQTEADPTYGGDKLADTQRLAALALDKVRPKGTPHGDSLRRLLVKTGYGNNLEIVSFLADLGKLMAEDTPGRPGSSDSGAPTDAATMLYGRG